MREPARTDLDTDHLSRIFFALADPTRRGLLELLAQGDANVSELAELFDLQLPSISKHLKVLQSAGLVVQGRDGQCRPCRLEAVPLRRVSEWIWNFQSFWEDEQRALALRDEHWPASAVSRERQPTKAVASELRLVQIEKDVRW